MYRYVKASDTYDYLYKLYYSSADNKPFYTDRASSYGECIRLFQAYQKSFPGCVISIYNLSTHKWMAWKKSSL